MAHLSEARSGRDVTVVWAFGRSAPQTATEMLRAEVGMIVGTVASEVRLSRSCGRCGSSTHGRPVVLPTGKDRAPFVSLSRAGAAVAVAVSEIGPVGVDIERLDAAKFAGFDGVALHERESASTVEARVVTWVRKESLLKAAGHGLHVDPSLVRLGSPHQPPRLVEWLAPDPPLGSVWMQDVAVDGHAACVTVLCDEAPVITVRQEAPAALPR